MTAKVKAVLPNSLKSKTEKLGQTKGVSNTYIDKSSKSNILLKLQKTLIDNSVISISYTNKKEEKSQPKLEPFALYANQKDEWVLVAFCRLKKDFSSFSLLSIETLIITDEIFEPHKLTFRQYLKNTYGNKSR